MKIRRHSIIEMTEHWTMAICGIMLLFTGIGELPLYKRYYFILQIPGLGWAGDYFTHLMLHYIFSIFFVAVVVFHIIYHSLRQDNALIPKKGDLRKSVHVLLAMIGIGEEPPSEKYLPEQRIAYVGMAAIILILTLTGMFKVVKNIPYLYVPPFLNAVNTLIHTLAAFAFLLFLIVHLGVFIFKSNWPLLKSMFTGKIDIKYVKKRHGLWYEELKKKGVI